MRDFKAQYGPWALIAGASEGTGRAFAHKIASLGLNCILVARREGPLNALAQEIRAGHGVECMTAGVDLLREFSRCCRAAGVERVDDGRYRFSVRAHA